jgi:ubiquinone/menaquinone biosynthesis C-methylase UbiE
MSTAQQKEQLRQEFNRWAESGKGESMQHEHWPITRPVLEQMQIQPNDKILDVGCGAGWLTRILAERVPNGRAVGTDISNEMIERARLAGSGLLNLEYVVGGVEDIPWQSDFFDKAISVESSYYWPDPLQGLREIRRILRPAGSAWILINYFRDNPYCHQWGALLQVPTRLLSAAEWQQLFRDAGFGQVAHQLVPDPTPPPEPYTGRWFRDSAQLRAFREIGALLVSGHK